MWFNEGDFATRGPRLLFRRRGFGRAAVSPVVGGLAPTSAALVSEPVVEIEQCRVLSSTTQKPRDLAMLLGTTWVISSADVSAIDREERDVTAARAAAAVRAPAARDLCPRSRTDRAIDWPCDDAPRGCSDARMERPQSAIVRLPAIAMLVMAVACDTGGNVSPVPADAVMADAVPADGLTTVPDASGLVTVSVRVADQPVVGAQVFFQNPDHSLASVAVTGSSGTAVGTIEAGGVVTVKRPTHPDVLETWIGVKPGDALSWNGWGIPRTEIAVAFTAPVDPGSALFVLRSTCSDQFTMRRPDATHPTLWLPASAFRGCDGTADIAVISIRPFPSTVRRVLYVPSVPVTDGATIDLQGAYEDPPPVPITWTNVPTDQLHVVLEIGRGPSVPLSGGSGIWDAVGGTVNRPYPWEDSQMRDIPAAPHVFWSTPQASHVPPGFHPYTHVVDWAQGPRYDIDLADALLEVPTSPPVVEAATRRVTWTPDGVGVTPDAVRVELVARRGSDQLAWNVVAPYASGSVDLPDLPDELDLHELRASDAVTTRVTAIQGPGGYDALRPRLHANPEFSPRKWPDGTPAGRVRYSHYWED